MRPRHEQRSKHPDQTFSDDWVRLEAEIKPSNPSAQERGRGQVEGYVTRVTNYYASNKTKVDEAFRNKMEIFKQCISDGAIRVKGEVRVYDLCPPDGKLFNDFVVPPE